MKLRGLRLEADEPTPGQQRNRRWLAEHPGTTTMVTAVVAGALVALVAAIAELSPSGVAIAAAAGALFGATVGWGFSVEHREEPVRGRTRLLYLVCLAVVGVVAIGGKLLT